MYTPFHSKYYAYELTRKYSSHQLEKLSQSMLSASVDLNPHQIDAALFAFRSPLSRGAILADEVGLGKTIEAGLIISQLWAEHKRRILCITPAALRKQWGQELADKFFIPSVILESASYNQLLKNGDSAPFHANGKVVICSYQFAKAKASEIGGVPWDLVVMDEAHRLRNVYKKDNKIAKTIRAAIESRPKILLTATPLQNSLMELYGLISFIDPHIFGDTNSFREQFAMRASTMNKSDFESIRSRISPVCQRTLRRQVVEYVPYTNRRSITQDFTPTKAELELYDKVSSYLQKPSYALPAGQRTLLTLVIRKILASSSFAISDTLGIMIKRLEDKLQSSDKKAADLPIDLSKEYESLPVVEEEWKEDEEEKHPECTYDFAEPAKTLEIRDIQAEIYELKKYKSLAGDITENAKGNALLTALKTGFAKAKELNAPHKALIFTESRRTQQYLKELLEQNGYAGQVVTLNGVNTEEHSKALYKSWLKRHEDDDCVCGSYNIDVRAAIVEEFRDSAQIMIATESGAEGLNLQFCSLVVNYDLPWNPQRIEQRIGRCHRYGQKHDVVVINFLNRKNEADKRVFEILSDKLRLFSGIFGASDEILGALGAGIDFEKRIHTIYQSCRSEAEINDAFDRLKAELDQQIQAQMQDTRAKLLENFDEDVHRRLKTSADKAGTQVNCFSEWLWRLTSYELGEYAIFSPGKYVFNLHKLPNNLRDRKDIPIGEYQLVTQQNAAGHTYRLGHPLAEALISQAKTRELDIREIAFHHKKYKHKISVIESLKGQSGWLTLSLLNIKSLETEEHLVFSAIFDNGKPLDEETCAKFFIVPAEMGKKAQLPDSAKTPLSAQLEKRKTAILAEVLDRNKNYFDTELEKLEHWSDDLKENLEREIKDLDREIKTIRRESRQCAVLHDRLELLKKGKELEKGRNEKRKRLFEEQDKVDDKKDTLINRLEEQLNQQVSIIPIFTLRWVVV